MLEVEEGASPGASALGDAGTEAGAGRPDRTGDRLFLASVAFALLPIVVAVVRAAREGWLPIGDNAYFAIRAADTFTEHHPLLGTWTSASLNAGVDFNNPGPLLFQLLAPATKLFDGGIGVAVGAAVLNGLAVVGIAVVARRRGGPVLGTAAMAVTALLCWSLGSELLFDPWQPNSLLLTFLFALMLVWSLVCGDVKALPWAVGVTSVIVQTHLSYVVLLVALGAWALVGLALWLRRERAGDARAWAQHRRTATRAVVAAVVVGALCWSQPLWEQLTGEGEGNLSRLAGNMTTTERRVGVELGTRIVADVLVPPFWLRPSYGEALVPDPVAPPGSDVLTTLDPSFPLAAVLVAALVALMAAAIVVARRRGDRVSAAALSTALVVGGAGLLTAWNLPYSFFGVSAHQFRWLWPTAAFVTFAVVVFVARRLLHADVPRAARRGVAVLAGVTAVVALANLPANNQRTGPSYDDWAIPVMQELNEQMAVLEGEGTLLIDFEGTRFTEPYSGAVMAELQRRGIPFVTDDEVIARQLGTSRRLEGTAPRLQILQGQRAFTAPPGSRRVALVEGLTADEQAEQTELASLVTAHLRDVGVRLTPEGDAVLERPEHADARAAVRAGDVDRVVGSYALGFLVDNDLLQLDDEWAPRFERYADLQRRWDRDTVALYLKPFDA